MPPNLVLASRSPRRQSLLNHLGVDFEVIGPDIAEVLDGRLDPAGAAEKIALQKATAVADKEPNRLVLAADTIVVLDGQILGKPESPLDAVSMLKRLRGRTHEVFTGVALIHRSSDRVLTAHEKTIVHFAPISDDEVAAYVAAGSPLDKAGAYGIQDDRGALFVSGIEGDYYNVMGLPIHLLYRLCNEHFPDLSIF